MTAYLINIALLILFACVLSWHRPSLQNKKFFCVIATLQWIILSGLRHYSIGTDTVAYMVKFESINSYSWLSLWDIFNDIIVDGAPGKDPGYSLFEKFISIFTTDYQAFLIVIALIFMIPLGIWIYKNSSEPLMSFLIYSCLFSSFFAITGIRQTIATALVVPIGYKFIKERRFLPFLVLILVAATIHKSATCFLPFYFIANKKITRSYLIMLFVLIPSFFVFRNQVMVVLGTFMGYEQFINQYEGAGTWTFTALLIMITGITLLKYKLMQANNAQVTHYVNALFCAMVFIPLTFVDPSAMRVVQYYSLFLMLLVPEIIRSFNARERIIVYYVATVLLIGLFAKNDPQYLFFWQG